jgi:hypothetical protein
MKKIEKKISGDYPFKLCLCSFKKMARAFLYILQCQKVLQSYNTHYCKLLWQMCLFINRSKDMSGLLFLHTIKDLTTLR